MLHNYQFDAVRIEQNLRTHGYAQYGDANFIRANPMEFMDGVLKRYEKISEEHEEKAADFWEVYEDYKGLKLDEFPEEVARNFINDVTDLFK